MKTKRVIAFITMLIMSMTVISQCFVTAFAGFDSTTDSGVETFIDDVEVSGTNSVGDLLASEFQSKQAEQLENNGYNIFSIEMENNIATVDFQVQGDCTLIVGIYDDSATTMLASGTAEVQKEETLTTVEIPIIAMPDYFYIKAYLIKTDTLEPLCIEYTNPNYTQHMQEFFSKTTDDFDEEKVLNFDDDKTNNFAVYSDDVIIIPYEDGFNTSITYDEDMGCYVVENPSEYFYSLSAGDIFSYNYEDTDIVVKIKSIEESGNNIFITEDETSMDEVFDYVRIKTSQDLSEADVTCHDGAVFIEDGTVENDTEQQNIRMPGESPIVKETELSSGGVIEYDFGERLSNNTTTTTTANNNNNNSTDTNTTAVTNTTDTTDLTNNTSTDTTTTEKNSGVESEISGKIKFSFNSSAVIHFDGLDSYFELKFDYNFGIFLTINLKAYKNIPLADVVFSPIPSITITAKPKIVIEAEVELDIDYIVTGCIGFRADKDGVHDLSKNPTGNPEITLSGRVYIGIELDPQLVFVDEHLIEATLTANAGFEITAEISKSLEDYMDSDTYHECNLCVAGGLDFVLSIDLNAKFIKFFEISAQPIAIRPHLFNFYYSIDNNEFGIGDCPHILHRFEIDIKDADSNPIEDMTVTAKSDGTVKYLAGNFISDLPDVLMTDSDGKIVLFSNLSTDLTFEKDGYEPTNLYVYAVKDTADTGVMVYLYNDETEIVDIGSPIVITIPYGQPMQTTTETTTTSTTTTTTTVSDNIVDSGTCGADEDNLTWTLDNEGTLTISGTGGIDDYYHYNDDYAPWRNSRNDIKTVIINDGVTRIGAFHDCDNLTSIIIPDSVTGISYATFANCGSLTSIIIPEGVKYIGESAFSGCISLTSINIPEGVKSIGDRAFYDCTNLTSITIPDSVTDIGDNTFSGCENLESVTISNNVTSIGWEAFWGCKSLTSIIIPNSVARIDNYAFAHCYNLESIIIKNPDCYIYDDSETFSRRITIYGYSGSKAEAYAEKYDRSFVALDEPETISLQNETPEILSDMYEISDKPMIITVKIKDLKPDTVYNYYKFHTTETDNLFEPSNFMYITQFKTDEYGFAEFVTGTNERDDNAVSMRVCASSGTESIILGDVNQDGMTDASDASQILKIYAIYSTGGTPTETAEQLLSADVNGDGMIDASDASTVLAYYAYLSTGGTVDIETFMST